MPKGWKPLSVKNEVYHLIDRLRGRLSFSDFLEDAMSKLQRQEIVRTRDAELDVPCVTRFEDQGVHVCCRRAPNTKALETLKICLACPSRLTPEKAERERTETHHYPMCGAKEYQDGKKLLVYSRSPSCPKHLQNTWHSVEACVKAECSKIKTYQVRVP